MSRTLWCLIIAFLFGRAARGNDPLVAVAAAGHRQTLDSIQTLRVRMRIEARENAQRPVQVVIDYWQDGDKNRARKVSDGHFISNEPEKHIKVALDSVTRGGRLMELESTLVQGRLAQNQARIENIDPTSSDNVIRVWSLIGVKVSDRPPTWLKDVLEGPVREGEKWMWVARREDLDGRSMMFLEGKVDVGRGLGVWRFWLDPAAGYLPRKVVCFGGISRTTEDNPVTRYEVIKFHPPYKDTGIRFPAEATMRHFATDGVGSTTIEEKMAFEDVRINDPIPDETFDLKIPPNCWVIDRTGGGQYHTGPDGKPLTPPQPIVPVPPPDELPAPSAWGWRHYLLIIGGSALCLLAVALLVRRGRGGPAVPQPATGG